MASKYFGPKEFSIKNQVATAKWGYICIPILQHALVVFKNATKSNSGDPSKSIFKNVAQYLNDTAFLQPKELQSSQHYLTWRLIHLFQGVRHHQMDRVQKNFTELGFKINNSENSLSLSASDSVNISDWCWSMSLSACVRTTSTYIDRGVNQASSFPFSNLSAYARLEPTSSSSFLLPKAGPVFHRWYPWCWVPEL